MTPPLRVSHVAGFLALSHGWTWAFWGLAALLGTSVWQWPAVLFFYIGGAGVVIGGVVMTGSVYGARGLRELGRRVIDPRPIRVRWWAVIALFYPLLAFAAAALALAFGATDQPLDLQGAASLAARPAALLALIGFILLIGPLPEEIGWRGYLQDRLQVRASALVAALLVGAVWWVWHLPLFALPGYYDAFPRGVPSPLDSLLGIMPAAVLYAWVYNNTSRSVLAVILFHFMENFTSQFLGIADAARPYRLALMIGLAVTVVAWSGARHLRRARTAEATPAARALAKLPSRPRPRG